MRLLARTTIVAACLAVSACGGHTVTKKDVIARANGICITALRSMRELPPPAGTTGLADYLDKVAPIVENEATQTRALPRPAQDRASPEPLRGRRTATATRYRAARHRGPDRR